MNGISLCELSFGYGAQPVLRGISLNIWPGERVALIGQNGSGKTTLLKIIGGLLSPQRGSIMLDGRSLSAFAKRSLARRIAVVPQEFVVPFAFTVRELVDLGRTPHLPRFGNVDPNPEAVDEAMGRTDTLHLENRIFNELSGGERQRVIIAMALAQRTDILLLDEPIQQLDLNRQAEVLDCITELNLHQGFMILAAIHDLNLAAMYFDRIVLLHDGTVLADGKPSMVLTAKYLEKAYGGRLEIVRTGSGSIPLVIPIPRFRGGMLMKEEG